MTNELPTTLMEAIRFFDDPEVCQQFMVTLRWPDGVVKCPTCGRDDVRYISTRRLWECKDKHARRQFSVKVGTIFEDSPIGIDKWLAAVWMLANDKNGISSYEVSRALGVTQKTAWFMLHRIRLALEEDGWDEMRGTVEVDETYVGGRSEFMHKARRQAKITSTGPKGKTAVFGLLERHGPDGHSRVRAEVVSKTTRKVLTREIRSNVAKGSELMSDAHPSYWGLNEFVHDTINHAEEYVRGKVHTNGIENFWSLLKRAIKGTYVAIEPFHLDAYIDEQVFRFNNRHDTDGGRFKNAAGGIVGKRLTYAELIGSGTTPA
jgi:transposase-like protein